jgi:sporulation protein YpjB
MLAKKQRWILFMVLVMMVLGAGCGNAGLEREAAQESNARELEAQLEQMNSHADRMYEYMKSGDVVEARSELLKISEELQAVAFHDVLTAEGYEAVQVTVFEAKKTFNKVSFNMDQGIVEAAKIRLLFDSITHEHQPMWLQYHKLLKNDTSELQDAVQAGNLQAADNAVMQLEYHYSIIRPAALIQRDAADIVKCDSLFAFMKTASNDKNLEHLEKGANEFEAIWDDLFHNKDAPTYGPIIDHKQPIYWTLGIGSAIFTVLAFVAWKKFNSSRGYVAVKRPNGDDRA